MKNEITNLPDSVSVLIFSSYMLTGGLLLHLFGSGERAALVLEVFCTTVGGLALLFALASIFALQTTLLIVNTLFGIYGQENPTSSSSHAETRKTRLTLDKRVLKIAIQRTELRCCLVAALVLILLPEIIKTPWLCGG